MNPLAVKDDQSFETALITVLSIHKIYFPAFLEPFGRSYLAIL